MINDPLLNPYIQRLDELPYIIQRHITQLKDSPTVSLNDPLSPESLLEAVSISARKLQITGELAGQLQMAVYSLDNSLRNLIENVTEEQGSGISNLSLPKKSSKHQYLQRGPSSKKELSAKRLTRSISGRQKPSSGSKRTSKRSQSSSRKKSKRLSSGHKKRVPRQTKSEEEEEEVEEPTQENSLEEEVEDQASSASIEEEPEEEVSRRNIEDPDLPEIACLCKKPPYGEMVGCDNPNCPVEWFHLDCVGLDRPPTETTWLCPQCSSD